MTESPLIDLLKQFPNCKVTISSRSPRRRPREGDTKTLKNGTVMVRRQRIVYEQGRPAGYQVRNGRPVFEWIKKEDVT